ncbi:MAG: hypothetical protein PHV75_02750 [Victivallaceae bacterium]|nr:hypothetical protein [Victivallaceae bacterium]NLK82802.1 hypothetical protein [Lentisphaerota bacterium]MDD3116747.1 hypothetical protein [Victivallaceae bacterium]MDD3703271.1 hypothetical protein [Victivallaceae bacterium]MDD4317418.1 hypothetical protein [Victivallaceae bacterium]
MKINMRSIFSLLLLVFLTSCQSVPDNSYLNLANVVNHLELNGIKITQIQPLDASLLGASEAVAVMIGRQEIGIYKYDIMVSKQRKILERARENEYIYVAAMKYPTIVKGAFVFIGIVNHPQKIKLIEAIQTLK